MTDALSLIFGGVAVALAAFQFGIWWREQHPRLPRINVTVTGLDEDCEECEDGRNL